MIDSLRDAFWVDEGEVYTHGQEKAMMLDIITDDGTPVATSRRAMICIDETPSAPPDVTPFT